MNRSLKEATVTRYSVTAEAPARRFLRVSCFPMRGEVLVVALGLRGNQHLFVAQRLDVVGVRGSASTTILLGMSGLQLHGPRLVRDQCWKCPEIISSLLSICQQSTVSLRAMATA